MLEILSANFLTRLLALAAATWLTFGWCRRFGNAFVPLACGLLLSVALGHLLPEAFSSGVDPERVGQSALAVVVFFVLFEGLLHAWGGHAAHGARHPHGNDRGVEAFALLFGCSLHGFVDGIVASAQGLFDSSAPDVAEAIGRAYIECSRVSRINFIAGGEVGDGTTVMGSPFAGELAGGEYKLKGRETYVRAECIDMYGRKAWTNPIFLK